MDQTCYVMLGSISTHAPRKGSDTSIRTWWSNMPISTHAPRKGSDRSGQRRIRTIWDFNPRPPQGERRDTKPHYPHRANFNPRPPQGERLDASLANLIDFKDFNPRPPQGERHPGRVRRRGSAEFQPTPPARGATRTWYHDFFAKRISTHAPRKGSDQNGVKTLLNSLYFNPRPPQGERRGIAGASSPIPIFQPTPPARGATGDRRSFVANTDISTHAPRKGSDLQLWSVRPSTAYFNPRPPQGERHAVSGGTSREVAFQPTPPARGAT